jgi:bifunctional non-homologous end joining protein LigD
MLATPWPAAFDDDAWQFEPKWDGVRALVGCRGGMVEVRGRRGDDVTGRYPEVAAAFATSRTLVLDGEIVTLDDTGRPSFERLQRRIHLSDPGQIRRAADEVPATFVAFDLLHEDSPLTGAPLIERRARLEALGVTATPVVVGRGTALWAAVSGHDLEGIVAKRLASPYRPGIRSPDWRKVVRVATIRAVVGGYTSGTGSRTATFGSLLVGLWERRRLRFVGAVGIGFDEARLVAIRDALDQMERPDSPFRPGDLLPAGARWVEPSLVAVVGLRAWTSSGRLRQPRFLGLAADPPDAITWEAEGPGAGASPQ